MHFPSIALAAFAAVPAFSAQEAEDPLVGLRLSLRGKASVGIATERRALKDSWVHKAIERAVKVEGRASASTWKRTYLPLGRWNDAARAKAVQKHVHWVLVVQGLKIKKGSKVATTFRPVGGGNSKSIKFQGAEVELTFRSEAWDPITEDWWSSERWVVKAGRTKPPASLNLSEVKNGLLTLDPADVIVREIERTLRGQTQRALRHSVKLPLDRAKDWSLQLTPIEERELWRRFDGIGFGGTYGARYPESPLPTKELAELAMARLEAPDPKGETKLVRIRAARFLRTLLLHYEQAVGATWPRAEGDLTSQDAARFRALFKAGQATLDSAEGAHFDPSKGQEHQSRGRARFDLLIHEDALEPGLISNIPFAGVARSYLVVVRDDDSDHASKEWKRHLKLTGAAIVERRKGKLVTTAKLSPRDVTSASVAQLLLDRLRPQ